MKLPTERQLRFGAAFSLGTAVAAMGYYSSFGNLKRYATEHAYPFPAGLPLGLDFAIPALLLIDSLKPSRFLRYAAWTLTAFTVAGNAAVTPGHSWVDRSLHALLPLVSVIFFEAARRYNHKPDPSRMDRIRWSRYIVRPVRTVRLRARMVAWETTNYRDALAREAMILYARTVLCAEYSGRSWRSIRRSVPLSLRHQLDTGQLPDLMLYGTDWHGPVRAWVLATLEELDPGRVPVPESEPRSEPASEPVPVPVHERDPWDRAWDRLEDVELDGISPDQMAIAYALARRNYAQVRKHISGNRLYGPVGIGKSKALTLARLIETAVDADPDRWNSERSQPDPLPAPVNLAKTGPEPAALASLNGGPVTAPPAP